MKVSKRDFLKLFSGGTAMTAAVLAEGSNVEPREVRPLTREQVKSTIPKMEQPPQGGIHDPLWIDPVNTFLVTDRILYDRIQFSPGDRIPATLGLFKHPLRTTCPYTGTVKNLHHTNMRLSGRLPEPCLFWIRRIHIVIGPDPDPQALRSLADYGWQLWLGNKRYADGTLLMDAQPASIVEVQKGKLFPTRISLELHVSNGLFIPRGMYFSAECQSDREHRLDRRGTGLDFMMALEGVEARPVQ